MLILSAPTKRKKSCCGNCKSGKPCCGKKARPRPNFYKHRGLWLPRKRFDPPKALLQYPSEAEWAGLWRPWVPPLAQVIDMSCMPCCVTDCCGLVAGDSPTLTMEAAGWPDLDGRTFPMPWDAGTLSFIAADQTINACTIVGFELRCTSLFDPGVMDEIDCLDFDLLEFTTACGWDNDPAVVDCSCNPLELEFTTIFNPGGDGGCCDALGGVNTTVTLRITL